MTQTLLPSHRPAIEKSIDLAAAKALDKLPIIAIDTNPDTCTPEVLQVLAHSYGANIQLLGLEQARRLVKNALLLKRSAGTVYATRKALESLFPTATLVEYEDEPWIFGVNLPVEGGDIYSAISHAALLRALKNAKNERSHLKAIKFDLPDSTHVSVCQTAAVLAIEGDIKLGFSIAHGSSFQSAAGALKISGFMGLELYATNHDAHISNAILQI